MTALAAARHLFDAFHERGIQYCHWKSNEHLLAGMRGDTDLDVLIDRRQYLDATAVLAECGFRRFDAVPKLRYPAIEDYLALDCGTGRLVHCHLHCQLVAGEPHHKGYRLPWERRCLATRRWDEEAEVFVADPSLELLLLLLRYAIKLRVRDRLRSYAGRGFPGSAALAEYSWLRARADVQATTELCRTLLGERAVPDFEQLLRGDPSLAAFSAFRRSAEPTLARLRSSGNVATRVRRWTRELAWVAAGMNRRYLGFRSARPLRRTSPSGGTFVALIGSDGSGKSTLTSDVASLYGSKLDVFRVYFGSGDGPVSPLRWPLTVARYAAVRLGLLGPRPANGDGDARANSRSHERGTALRLARVVWALALALEKRRRLRTAWAARNRGMLVVADRYPQAQIAGFNDGPLLRPLAATESPLLRRLAAWEAAPYEWAQQHPPDLVIRLDVSPEVADRRKPETGTGEVVRRVSAVRSLRFGGDAAVVTVNADRELSQVQRDVRAAVWRNL